MQVLALSATAGLLLTLLVASTLALFACAEAPAEHCTWWPATDLQLTCSWQAPGVCARCHKQQKRQYSVQFEIIMLFPWTGQ